MSLPTDIQITVIEVVVFYFYGTVSNYHNCYLITNDRKNSFFLYGLIFRAAQPILKGTIDYLNI